MRSRLRSGLNQYLDDELQKTPIILITVTVIQSNIRVYHEQDELSWNALRFYLLIIFVEFS